MKQLSLEKMEKIEAGDYCSTLQMIVNNNAIGLGNEGPIMGFDIAGCGRQGYNLTSFGGRYIMLKWNWQK